SAPVRASQRWTAEVLMTLFPWVAWVWALAVTTRRPVALKNAERISPSKLSLPSLNSCLPVATSTRRAVPSVEATRSLRLLGLNASDNERGDRLGDHMEKPGSAIGCWYPGMTRPGIRAGAVSQMRAVVLSQVSAYRPSRLNSAEAMVLECPRSAT